MSKKVTTIDLINELKAISPNIEVLGEYSKAKDPIHCRCKKCGHEWDPTPSNLKKGRGCPRCGGHYRLSHNEFVTEVALKNPTVEILGIYVAMGSRILVRCKKCGKEWNPIAESIYIGSACRACSYSTIIQKITLSPDDIYERMHKAHPEIEIIGTFIDMNTPVKCRCSICGYEWSPKGSSLRDRKGCPSCTHQISLSHEEFVDKVATISPTIEILSKYEKRKTRMRCRCKVCGHEWSTAGDKLLEGSNCPACADAARDKRNLESRKKHNDYILELETVNPFVEILGTYVNSTTRIRVRCKHCGHVWTPLPNNLLRGQGCPECSSSSSSFMEKMIVEAFRECLGADAVLTRDSSVVGYELDVYIPELSLAIEPGSWFWHKDKIDFDRKKREACSDKGIRLITIYDSYDEQNPPFSTDYYTVAVDLGQEKNHISLKSIIGDILKSFGIDKPFTIEEWNRIEDRAYLSSRKMNTEDFKALLKGINPSIIVLGEYKSSSKPIHCRCSKCGHEWDPLVHVLTNNRAGCPKCARNLQPTHDEFVQILKNKNPTLTVLGKYVNSQTHIDVKCNECGCSWPVKPNNLMQGNGCPKCGRRRSSLKQRKSHEQFLIDMKEKGNPNVEILGSYVNSKIGILCRCKVCGYEWSPVPSSLLKGHGCRKCAVSARNTHKE